jgi:hypothetical protein
MDDMGSTPIRIPFFEYKTLKIQLKYEKAGVEESNTRPTRQLEGCLTATTI